MQSTADDSNDAIDGVGADSSMTVTLQSTVKRLSRRLGESSSLLMPGADHDRQWKQVPWSEPLKPMEVVGKGKTKLGKLVAFKAPTTIQGTASGIHGTPTSI
ncbi:hypothetical protein F0562_015449 [Nyssa sinensis]|uniref:Uncharacterized protein n=1 Tax=Nyssa sinensis TaxID=561372 RepID=A0A5J4ZHF3_9ASTE|nr:hypothetical protein F0562_015449 [Nyssa sinensis]